MSVRHLTRLAVVPVAIVTALAAATPASASLSPAFFDVDVFTSPTLHTIFAECEISVGVTTDARHVTYVVHASATASGPSPAIATGVQCVVYDALDSSRTYGGASAGMPGGHAEAVGFATVPLGRVPAACVTGGATYLDGSTASSSKSCP